MQTRLSAIHRKVPPRRQQMRKLRAEGLTYQQIGDRLGVTRSDVSGVLFPVYQPKRWKRKCPRCPCGAYVDWYAVKIGHHC